MRLIHPALLVVLGLGCDQKPPEPTPDKPAPAPTTTSAQEQPRANQPAKDEAAGDISWSKPDAWKEAPNPSAMRKATYTIPRAEGDPEDGELSVSAAGGSLDANVQRWRGQFDENPEPTTSKKDVNGIEVTVVELAGTFKGGGPMMGGSGEPKKDWMMLAAIVPTTPQMHFFKLTGPKKTVEAARADFDVLVGSVSVKK